MALTELFFLLQVKYGVQLLEKIPKHDRDLTYLQRVLVISLHLGCLLTRVMHNIPPEHEEFRDSVYKSTYHLVKLGIKGKRGRSLLHLACSRDSGLVGRYGFFFGSIQRTKPVAHVLFIAANTPPANSHRRRLPVC